MTDHLLYRFFFFTVIQVLAFTPIFEFFANNRILNLPLNFLIDSFFFVIFLKRFPVVV